MGRFNNDEFLRLVLDFGCFAAFARERNARYWFIFGRIATFPKYVWGVLKKFGEPTNRCVSQTNLHPHFVGVWPFSTRPYECLGTKPIAPTTRSRILRHRILRMRVR